jgi:type IV pilus assembly protein PilX
MEGRLMRYRKQRGIILIMALIVMASMTLAAVALVRNVDTGVLVAANLAFRQSATLAGDSGVRAATTWLSSNSGGSGLYNDSLTTSSAYIANAQNVSPAFYPPTYAWETGNNSLCINSCNADAAGNTVRYVVHRLCDLAGNPIGVQCIRPPATSGSTNNSSKGVVSGGSLPMSATAAAYYRVTTRVTGPRNTISYVQVIVY